ncbi:sensor histidine kinase [Actinomadura yumaensis]
MIGHNGRMRDWARAAAYLLLGGPLGALWWGTLTCGVLAGVLLAPLWIGVVFLALTAVALRLGGRLERALARHLLGAEIAVPYRPWPDGLRAQASTLLTDPATWRDLLFLLLRLPVAGAEALLLAPVAVGLTLAGLPVRAVLTEGDVTARFNGRRLFTVDELSSLPYALAGAALLVAVAYTVGPLGRAHRRLAESLLRPTAGSRARRLRTALDAERGRRAATLRIAAAERRRLERDLHDGAQQHLAGLALDLGMALRAMGDDAPEARRLVAGARDQAVRTLEEIRTLARGLHPAILAEQGLDAAMSALAGRCPVPVDVRVDCPHRPPPEAETVAYFVVSEALANVARHSGATGARVTVGCARGVLVAEVRDDGRGGARAGDGTGLAGLRDRVAALAGSFTVDSPEGGPTVVRAELPCGS